MNHNDFAERNMDYRNYISIELMNYIHRYVPKGWRDSAHIGTVMFIPFINPDDVDDMLKGELPVYLQNYPFAEAVNSYFEMKRKEEVGQS